MGGGFVPFRRRVHYVAARQALLELLKPELELCRTAMALRRGHLQLSAADFSLIANAMSVRDAVLKRTIAA